MKFDFEKFVIDIENRSDEEIKRKEVRHDIIEQDRLRRLRAERYHERWQNRIVWKR